MIETTEQWLARIGSREAMEERQALRLAGKLNRPFPPIGFRRCAQMLGIMREDKQAPRPEELPLQVLPPTHLARLPKGKGFKQPASKWSEQRGRSSN